jgi:ankyrin repeat protein
VRRRSLGACSTRIAWIALIGCLATGLGPLREARAAPADTRAIPAAEDPSLVAARQAVRLRDFEGAVKLWRKAAGRGNSEACYRLGVAYRSGRGVPQDSAKAIAWFEKAAAGGDRDAQFALGELLLNGHGVKVDRERGLELLGRAARAGHRQARETLARIQRGNAAAFATADARVAAHAADPREALNQAIRVGDVPAAREAISRGAPINGAPGDEKHPRPLILAIEHDRPEIVRLLLERGADPNRRSRIGEPALILAIRETDSDIPRQLLAKGASTATPSVRGYTPLMEAAQRGSATLVDLLLRTGADPRVALEQGTSAADIARRFGFDGLATRLRKAGAPSLDRRASGGRFTAPGALAPALANESSSTRPPLIEAARRGDAELVGRLITSGAKVDQRDADGETALHRAAEGGYADAVQKLLAAGAKVDAPGQDSATPLMGAMASEAAGSERVVELLLAAGADVHQRDHSGAGVIEYAARGATPRKLARLRAAGASWSDADASRTLERAVVEGNVATVGALIDVLDGPALRMPAVCTAIGVERPEILDRLLSSKPPLDHECGEGRTPLILAAHSGRADVVARLLLAGADPDHAAGNGDTPLIAAASRGHAEVVKQLLGAGASIDRLGSHRRTALMAAAASGHLDVVDSLLVAGANRRLRSESGVTASQLAKAAGHSEISERIEAHSAGWLPWK